MANLPEWFIGLIRCPNTGTKLTLASPDQLQSLQKRRNQGSLTTKLGRTFSGQLTQGLVSEGGEWFYPIEEAVICSLPDDAIRVDVI